MATQKANSRFVADGRERAYEAIAAEVRPQIEEKYVAEWNASGYFRRWFMLRRIDKEIDKEVAKKVAERISGSSLF